jgi:hypothetical protein
VANHIALNNALYPRHNQEHAYIVGNHIWLATEAAKSTKKSYAQVFLHLEQQQVTILQIHRDKRAQALQHHGKLKDDKKWHMPKQPEIVLKCQQSQQTIHKNIH